jgi:CheY-like chemotaxis protein
MAYRNLLLIDDDEDDHHIFMMAATEVSSEISCKGLYDAREALNKISSGEINPDVIFLDLNMPLMNGEQFLSEIKKHAGLKEIPIIIFSTSSNQNTINSVKNLGAEAFITKPSLYDELINVLKPLLVK